MGYTVAFSTRACYSLPVSWRTNIILEGGSATMEDSLVSSLYDSFLGGTLLSFLS